MTPRAQDSAGKGSFSCVHNRQTNLTPRHVTTAPNMSAPSAMDQKEFEDRLVAAEALSSLGSISSVTAAIQDSGLIAQVSAASNMAPQNDGNSRKSEARGRGGGRKDEKGTGRENKSRSTRGRGRAKVVQADRTSTTTVAPQPPFPPDADGAADAAVSHASAAAATSKPSCGRGRRKGGGKRGSKTTQPVGPDGVGRVSESLLTVGAPPPSPHLSQTSPPVLSWPVSVRTGVGEMPGHVAHQQFPSAAAAMGRTVPQAASFPSAARYVGVGSTAVSLSSVGSSSATSSNSLTSPRSAASTPHTAHRSTPVTSSTPASCAAMATTLTVFGQTGLTSLRLDSLPSLPSLSVGGTMLPNLPSIPSLPSLPSAVASLHLTGAATLSDTPTLSEDGAGSQLSPQNRDSGEKSLPLKKRKFIDSSPPSSVLSVAKARCVSPVSPSMKSPGGVTTSAETLPSTSAAASAAEKSRDEVASPAAPVLPMNLLAQVLPPPMVSQLMAEIETAITPDEDGDVPLHIAVVHENEAMVKKLIQLMALAGQRVDRYNKQHQTPLHLAVKLTSLSSIQMLLEAGADSNLVDSGGLTSTHMAVQGQDGDCLEALLQWGRYPCDLNYRNFEGLAPLHTAVMNNDLEIVVRLLDQGADINIMDGKSGRTVLFHAAETNQRSAVELLLSRGADPEIANYAGVVPALAAQGRNHSNVARLLARALEEGGGDVRGEEKEGGLRFVESRFEREIKGEHPRHTSDHHPRLSTPTPTTTKPHTAKTARPQGPQPTAGVPAAPSILQSSSVPGGLPRGSSLRSVGPPAAGKPSEAGPAPRRSLPGSVIRATHTMPGVVSKTAKTLPGTPPRSVVPPTPTPTVTPGAAMVRRNSVPAGSNTPVTWATFSKSSTPPPLNLASAALPLGLVRAGMGDNSCAVSHSSGSGVKIEVGLEEYEGQGQRSAAAAALIPDDLKKLLMQNLLKFVAQKQNGGQARVVNFPPMLGGAPLALTTPPTPTTATTTTAAETGLTTAGSPFAPVRGVNRVMPLSVPTTSMVTSPAMSERVLSPLTATTPSAAHLQPMRPLLVVRSSATDPVTADGRRMGSVELRHVTTDAILALQHSATNSVSLASQGLSSSSPSSSSPPSPLHLPAPGFLPNRLPPPPSPAAGFTVAMETEKVPPVSNHVARINLPSQTLTYAVDGYCDEPKDLSLKSRKKDAVEEGENGGGGGKVKGVAPVESNLNPSSSAEGPKPAGKYKGGGGKKRQSETSVQDQSKPTQKKVPRIKSVPAVRTQEKMTVEDALSPNVAKTPQGGKWKSSQGSVSKRQQGGVIQTPQGSSPSDSEKTDGSFTHSPEGAVISISESGVITSETTFDGSMAPVVEMDVGAVVKVDNDSGRRTTSSSLSHSAGPRDEGSAGSEQFLVKPLAPSHRLRIPDPPRKKTAKGDRAAKSRHDASPHSAKPQTDTGEGREGEGETDRSAVAAERGDKRSHNKDGRGLTPMDLQAKDQSLATG